MKIYRPVPRKILRDISIVSVLLLGVVLIGAPFAPERLPVVLSGIALLKGFYYLIMGVLPYIKITDSGELEYRSDYGVTHKIKVTAINKITKGSGLGGYEHALFIYHSPERDEQIRFKLKSSYFDRSDLIDFIGSIQNTKNIETNLELREFLSTARQ